MYHQNVWSFKVIDQIEVHLLVAFYLEDIRNCSYFPEPQYKPKALNTGMLVNPIYFLNGFNYVAAVEYDQIILDIYF